VSVRRPKTSGWQAAATRRRRRVKGRVVRVSRWGGSGGLAVDKAGIWIRLRQWAGWAGCACEQEKGMAPTGERGQWTGRCRGRRRFRGDARETRPRPAIRRPSEPSGSSAAASCARCQRVAVAAAAVKPAVARPLHARRPVCLPAAAVAVMRPRLRPLSRPRDCRRPCE
jgi:hypothetical protein